MANFRFSTQPFRCHYPIPLHKLHYRFFAKVSRYGSPSRLKICTVWAVVWTMESAKAAWKFLKPGTYILVHEPRTYKFYAVHFNFYHRRCSHDFSENKILYCTAPAIFRLDHNFAPWNAQLASHCF